MLSTALNFWIMLVRFCEASQAVEIFLRLSELSQKLTSMESTIVYNTHTPDNYWLTNFLINGDSILLKSEEVRNKKRVDF